MPRTKCHKPGPKRCRNPDHRSPYDEFDPNKKLCRYKLARKPRFKAQREANMSKTKANGVKAAKPEKDVLSKVKAGGITKPVAAAKSKGKELAKAIATEDSKSKKQKKVKEPTPESESDSEASEEEESEESSESESEDESESEAAPVTNGKALKGKAKPAPASDSEDSDSSEESDDEEPAAVAEASSADESESDSDESAESEDEKPAAAAAVKKAKKVDDDDSEDASEDSDDSSDDAEEDSSEEESDEEEEEAKPVSKKRKAEDESPFAAKKNKAEAEASTSQGTNLFVGNLSWNIDEDWLSREFGEYGELSGVRIVYDRQSGRSKGFGYVEYVNAADAGKAYAARKDTDLDNRRINLDWASGRNNAGGAGGQERAQSRAKSFGDSTSPASDTLFVGNISFEADQDSVSEAFGEYGTITGVRLPTDRETGAPKGFGYVTFSSVEEATAAFEAMQGYNLSGRSLRLDYSTPRPSNGDSPRGGRGGFGGGRGGFGGRGGGRGGFGDRGGRGGARGGRGGARGGRGGTTNRGGFGDFSGKKTSFD